jgi:hypothetical protein
MGASWANLVVAGSNLWCLESVRASNERKDNWTTLCIGSAGIASMVSHLFQSHVHNQHGFGMSHKLSKLLNDWDIAAACVLTIRLLYLYYKSPNKPALQDRLAPFLLVCLIFNVVSTKMNTQLSFVILHSLWHLLIFQWVAEFVRAQ